MTTYTNIINKYTNFITTSNLISFMNDGYVELDANGFPIDTNSIDSNFLNKFLLWKYQIQLYKKCLDLARIEQKSNNGTLLDLSCGKGGGITFIKEQYSFKKLFGLDIHPEHIEICKKNISDVNFICSSATDIPLEDSSVDVITTVEAYTYYDPFEKYINECHRVLKPNGILIQAAPSSDNTHNQNHTYLNKFKIIFNEDITKNVRVACAISKYVLKEADKSGICFKVLSADENRYITGKSKYFINVMLKQP